MSAVAALRRISRRFAPGSRLSGTSSIAQIPPTAPSSIFPASRAWSASSATWSPRPHSSNKSAGKTCAAPRFNFIRLTTGITPVAWMGVPGALHDSDVYGACRWPSVNLAGAAGVPLKLAKELAQKNALKGAKRTYKFIASSCVAVIENGSLKVTR